MSNHTFEFVIDLFNDYQEVTQDNGVPDPNMGEARSDGSTGFFPFNPSIRATPPDPNTPDGAVFTNDPFDANYSTDIPSVARRKITVDDASPPTPGPGNSVTVIDDGANEPGNGIARFSTDIGTLADTVLLYNADIDGDGEFGEPEDAFSVVVDCPPDGIDLTDIQNRLVFDALQVDPGLGEDATLRFEVSITDADGDTAELRLYATEAAVSAQNLFLPLGLFTGDILSQPTGSPFLNLSTPDPTDVFPGLFVAAGTINAALDFDQVTEVSLQILGNPASFGSPIVADGNGLNPFDPTLPAENPTEEAYDASTDNVRIETQCPAMLGDYVWEDTNANGIQDDGENGVAGVTVVLTGGGADGVIGTGDDDTEETQKTVENGLYKFADLNPGEEYKVTFSDLPAGFVFTQQNAGDDDKVDSDADPANGMTQIVTLVSGEYNDTLDAGILKTACIGDRVWEDTNANGIQDDGENGVAGVTVVLTGGGADGVIGTGDDDTEETQKTVENGLYKFADLNPGEEYKVTFSDLPAGFVFTQQNAGDDDKVDSDADPANGMTQIVTLVSGEYNDTLDAGILKTACIGDRVWEDTNANGIQDDGENGVAGVTVVLTGGGADGVIGTGDDDTEETQKTVENGLYKFADLNPGEEYKVTFSDLPAGFVFTQQNAGDDDKVDSDADPANGMTQIVTLVSGEYNDTLDAGILKTACIGDRVWEDTNANGIQDDGENGVAGVTVVLTGGGADGVIGTGDDDTEETQKTVENGLYKFADLNPGEEYKVTFSDLPAGFVFTQQNAGDDDKVDSDADPANGMTQIVTLVSGEYNDTLDAGILKTACIGDRVWEDTNANGIQDDGENGVAGVTVVLTGGGADGVIGTGDDDTEETQKTVENGLYKFADLNPGEEYKVTFSDLPAGFVFTQQNAGDDDKVDSDADPANGMTQIVTLVSGEYNDTLDAGILKTACIGDRVWEDTNANGIQDDGENGVAGVTVVLTGGGADGVIGTGDDDTEETQKTVENGLYKFADLNPGEEYKVTFSDLPAGFVFTQQNAGDDDKVDSDADPANGMTQIVTLVSGEYNDTLDAGILKTACIGDRVWEDTNANGIQDDGENGVAGVTVVLTGGGADGVIGTGDDDTEETQKTVENGLYKFADLNPGEEYKVTFSDLPAGFVFTQQNAGDDDKVDSDADPANGMTQIVTLVSGEYNDTLDAGILKTACIGDRVWEDTNANGIQDDGENGVAGVTVVLTGGGADGVIGTGDDDTEETQKTVENGLYKFADLNPGEEYKVTFSDLPAGFVFTQQNAGDDDKVDSDADPANGMTQIVTLVSGEYNDTLDAGILKTACIGDRVWEDTNANGIQDDGENGVAGVTVVLTGGGADGVIGTGDDDTEETQKTVENGLYKFADLNPGEEYKVTFSDLPAGFVFTQQNAGDDDKVDSDADPANGMTQIVTLVSGEYNDTLDAGITPAGDIDIEKFVCVIPGKDRDGKGSDGTGKGSDGTGKGSGSSSGKSSASGSGSSSGKSSASGSASGSGSSSGKGSGSSSGDGSNSHNGDKCEKLTFSAYLAAAFGLTNAIDEIKLDDETGFDWGKGSSNGSGSGSKGSGSGGSGSSSGMGSGGSTDHICERPGKCEFEDADDPTGPIARPGDKVLFKYEVTTGDSNVPLRNVAVTDNRLETIELTRNDFNVGDTNRNDLLDSDETWLYAAWEKAKPAQQMNTGKAVGTPEGSTTEVMDTDKAHYFGEVGQVIDIEKLVCVKDGKGSDGGTGKGSDGGTGKGSDGSGKSSASGSGKGSDGSGKSSGSGSGKGSDGSGKGSGSGSGKGSDNGSGDICDNPAFMKFFHGDDGSGSGKGSSSGSGRGSGSGSGKGSGSGSGNGSDGSGSGCFCKDADTAEEAVEVFVGEKVVFAYVVNNLTETSISDVQVTDDVLGQPKFLDGDDNENGMLDPGEKWLYAASDTAKEGLQTNKGTVTGRFDETEVMDMDPANYTGIEKPPATGDLCDVLGKPVALAFDYEPGTDVDTGQKDASAEGEPDDDGESNIVESYIVVGDKKGEKTFFAGTVEEGDQFTADASSSDKGRFDSNTVIQIFDDFEAFKDGDDPLQTMRYHTSCSQPIELGDVIGSVELVGYKGEDGAAGDLDLFG